MDITLKKYTPCTPKYTQFILEKYTVYSNYILTDTKHITYTIFVFVIVKLHIMIPLVREWQSWWKADWNSAPG